MMKVMVLAPHPDDESLGCGGAIAKHTQEKDDVHVVYLCDCGPQRADEALNACRMLGVFTAQVHFLGEPDGSPLLSTASTALLPILNDFEPDILYAPHQVDDHPDHKVAHSLAKHAAFIKRKIQLRLFEVWTPLTDPTLILDITPYIGVKMAALRCHISQFRGTFENKMDEGILGLNRYRAHVHHPNNTQGGILYAEAFENPRYE